MTFYLIFIFIIFLNACVYREYDVTTHRQNIFIYSTDKEVNLGRNLSRKIQGNMKISKDPLLLKRINDIGDKIVKVCDRKEINYYFYVIEDKELNAFSLPGGYIYVYRGLVDILDDDELAFVIAHEIAHIVSRHSIKKLQAAMGMNLLLLATSGANSDVDFQQGLSFALAQLFVAYSREDELKADELAAKYLKNAGFDPKLGVSALNKIYRENKKKSLRPYPYFRTHPYTAQRIRHIKETLGIPLEVSDYIN